MGGILSMNHLTNDDKEKLLSQMRNMDYVKSYDMMQRKGTMYQVKNRQDSGNDSFQWWKS